MVFVPESFTSDSSSKVHIFAHHSDPSSMNSAEVNIFKESDNVGLGSFLERLKGGGLESEFAVVSLCQ
jgi:hypothetical protein